jgi:hypothetical protein
VTGLVIVLRDSPHWPEPAPGWTFDVTVPAVELAQIDPAERERLQVARAAEHCTPAPSCRVSTTPEHTVCVADVPAGVTPTRGPDAWPALSRDGPPGAAGSTKRESAGVRTSGALNAQALTSEGRRTCRLPIWRLTTTFPRPARHGGRVNGPT